MNTNPFNYPVPQDDRKSASKLTDEFDPLLIMSQAAEQRADKSKGRRRSWLAAIGSWFVSLGLRLKHGAHPYFSARRMSPRPVSIHNYRSRRRR